MQQVQATENRAFAAILADGSVVTWGHTPTLVATALQFKISSRMCNKFRPQEGAFAAILGDRSIVYLGCPRDLWWQTASSISAAAPIFVALSFLVSSHVMLTENEPMGNPMETFCKKGRLAPGPWKNEPKLGLGLIIEL